MFPHCLQRLGLKKNGKIFFLFMPFAVVVLFCFTCLFETGTRTAHINHELTMTPRMILNSLSFASTSKVLKSQRPAPLSPSGSKVFINFYSKPLGTHLRNTQESMRQDGFLQIPQSPLWPCGFWAGLLCTAEQGSTLQWAGLLTTAEQRSTLQWAGLLSTAEQGSTQQAGLLRKAKHGRVLLMAGTCHKRGFIFICSKTFQADCKVGCVLLLPTSHTQADDPTEHTLASLTPVISCLKNL